MSFKVTLNRADGSAWGELTVSVGRTILETALGDGFDYPHGCRAGNCGGCKSLLIDGEVELSPYSKFALSDEERQRGLILTCRAVPWSDCAVQPVAADDVAVHASRRLICRVTEIEQATHDIRIVTLAIAEGGPMGYTAGQYASVTFAGQPARDFSFATSPRGDRLQFHIRRVAGGTTSEFVHRALGVGDRVEVRGPIGTAHYRPAHRGPVLLLAGGSGLAPIKAIVEAALADSAADHAAPLHLYFGARDERDVYLEAYFLSLAATHERLRYTVALSQPKAATLRRTGNLADVVAADFDQLDGVKAYLAGPPPMIEAATEMLLAKGLARRDCHADAFYTAAELAGRARSGRGVGS